LLRAADSMIVTGFGDGARRVDGGDVGEALLSTAADMGAGMLVMGGYGHSRYRELLLGGVTSTVLRAMTLPVLLAH
jgi:nucleotide-binding universal stress UspA family protein